MKNKNPKIPIELKEQSEVVQWLKERGIKLFSATAQSTFTGWVGINKNKMAGVQPGVPDLIICLPASETRSGFRELLFIEMKRIKGSHTSADQKAWIAFLEALVGDVYARVCKGAVEAIAFLEEHLKPPKVDPRPIEEQDWWKEQ